MTIASVIDQTDRLVRRAWSRDVYELCSFLHIKICRMDMQQKIKAYYFYNSRCQRIVIDSDICEFFFPVLIGHELAHAVLHRERAAPQFLIQTAAKTHSGTVKANAGYRLS